MFWQKRHLYLIFLLEYLLKVLLLCTLTLLSLFFSYEMTILKRQDHTRSHDITSNAMRKSVEDEDEDRDEAERVNSLFHLIPPAVNHC